VGEVFFEGKTLVEGSNEYSLILGPKQGPSKNVNLKMDEFAYSDLARPNEHFALGSGLVSRNFNYQFLDEAQVFQFFYLLKKTNEVTFVYNAKGTLPAGTKAQDFRIPRGLASFTTGSTASNRLSRLIKLGRSLFNSDLLSVGANGVPHKQLGSHRTMKCSTCHRSDLSFTDSLPTALGTAAGVLNTPSIINRIFARRQFFDGRSPNIMHQSLQPAKNPAEMGGSMVKILEMINATPSTSDGYETIRQGFREVYCGGLTCTTPIDEKNFQEALSAFVITRIANQSQAEFSIRNKEGDWQDLSLGKFVFENKGRCIACHNGPNFSDELTHDTGVESAPNRFKTPTLWNIANTAPYFHNGTKATLREVVDFYSEGFVANRNSHRVLDPELRPLALNNSEKAALVKYLEQLTPAR
jgi:cytochrome c peroxidase